MSPRRKGAQRTAAVEAFERKVKEGNKTTRAKAKVVGSPNPYRIETEQREEVVPGTKHFKVFTVPTFAIFTRKPSLEDIERVCREHPELTVQRRPMDKAGCVLKVNAAPEPEKVKPVLPPGRYSGVITKSRQLADGRVVTEMKGPAGVDLRQVLRPLTDEQTAEVMEKLEPTEPIRSFDRKRLNLTLDKVAMEKLEARATELGLTPTALARIAVMQKLGLAKEGV